MTLLHTSAHESQLSQAERLALCAGRFSPIILAPDSIGTPPVAPRFPSPCMARVREHDARLSLHGSPCNVASDEESDEESDDETLRAFALDKRRDSMREHSLLMPSQRGYAEAWQEARSYGYSND
jgi:hypothetical protein